MAKVKVVYRNLLNLLEKWPIDVTKKNRDFGQHLRQRIKTSFKNGEVGASGQETEWKNTYECLNRIADNYYNRLYERSFNSSATGLTAEQCKEIVSDDFMNFLKGRERNFVSRVLRRG